MCFLPTTGHPCGLQFCKLFAVSLSASLLSIAAQPAVSTVQPAKFIARPFISMDCIATGSFVQRGPTVSQQDRHVAPINPLFLLFC